MEKSIGKVYTCNAESVNQSVNQEKEVYGLKKASNNNVFNKKEVWLTVRESVNLLGMSKMGVCKNCKSGKYITKTATGIGGTHYLILLTSLPSSAQAKYWEERIKAEVPQVLPSVDESEIESKIYSALADWQKKPVDDFLSVKRLTAGLKGKEIKTFLESWNKANPDMAYSTVTFYRHLSLYKKYGISGIIPKWGKRAGQSTIKEEYFEFYKGLYLKEGGPSVKSCWLATLGYAKTLDKNLDANSFPQSNSFHKLLTDRIPEETIYLTRKGREAWNKKYANFISRDYSNIKPGSCYVSDHAQIDVAVFWRKGKISKPCFPWVTAWVDFVTGKWLGWMVHPESPNSDHIFQSFYYAVSEYGVPKSIYIDNGKDYRCKSFAGGRKSFAKVSVDEVRVTSTVSILGITPHYSLPYNAQTKPIERAFLKNKEWFSKHMQGYRGGNVVERPEKLADEIKSGAILEWDDFVQKFNYFITEVVNKMPSSGKNLKGKSPDEVWNSERCEPGIISKDSLKLLCMRTSRPVMIGRNGVKDSEIDCTYWAEWMTGQKGAKVYLRRDVKSYQEAWVFSAEDNSYIGKATIAERISALAVTDVEKNQLKEAMQEKRRAEKIVKSFASLKNEEAYPDKLAYMGEGVKALNEARGYKEEAKEEKIVRLVPTSMDQVVKKAKEEEQKEEVKKNFFVPEPKKEEKVKMFWYEVEDEETWLKRMSGGGRRK